MKPLLAALFISFIMILFYVENKNVMGKEERLISVINYLSQEDADIKEWSLYYKYDLQYIDTLKDFNRIEADVKEKYPEFIWTEDAEKNHHVKLTGIKKEGTSKEQVTLTAIKADGKYTVLHTYNYTGTEWLMEKYRDITKGFGSPENMFFTVKGEIQQPNSPALDRVASDVLSSLSATPVESLEEQDFVSISAYKGQWDVHLLTRRDKKMNLQLGLRRDAKKGLINVTIGSPIITVEY